MLVKVLEHKLVIRLFGVFLIFAPFFNIGLGIARIQGVQDKWTNQVIWAYLNNASKLFLVLQVASIVIGFIMLNGSRTVWKYILALLSGHVLVLLTQATSFKNDKTSLLFLFIDACLILFIADQLVWKLPEVKKKVKPQEPVKNEMPSSEVITSKVVPQQRPIVEIEKPQPAPTVSALPVPKTSKKILISFEGIGPWAKLKEVNASGIKVNCLIDNPPEMNNRSIEVGLGKELTLKLKFNHREEKDFYFDYVEISEQQKKHLNTWLSNLDKAA